MVKQPELIGYKSTKPYDALLRNLLGDQIVPPSQRAKRRRVEGDAYLSDLTFGYPTDYQIGESEHFQV